MVDRDSMYQTLYRRYRPIRFSDLIGQDHIVPALKNAIKTGRLAHAFLFAGQRGTGKTTTARILAMALNCRQRVDEEPCGQCESCVSIIKGSAMDVVELDAASHTGVDAIREAIVDRLSFIPAVLPYKVYIIDEVHMLSASSFAALLKSLEEPPPRVVFVLATTDPHRVPPTVRSRCLRFDFHPVRPSAIVERLRTVLKLEGWEGKVEEEALYLIARAGRGSVRDALTILEQVLSSAGDRITTDLVQSLLGLTESQTLKAILSALRQSDRVRLWTLVRDLVESGRDLHQLCRDLSATFRNLLAVKMGAPAEDLNHSLGELAEQWEEGELIRLLRACWDTERELRLSEDPQLMLEVGFLQMVRLLSEGRRREEEREEPPSRPASIPETLPAPADETVPTPIVQEGAEVSRDTDRLWSRFLEELKKQSVIAYSFFIYGEPVEVKGGQLVISFRRAFHYDRASDPRYLELAERVAREVYEGVQKIQPRLDRAAPEPQVGTAIKSPTASDKGLRPSEELLTNLFEEQTGEDGGRQI